jgi:hypothetical protein
MADDPSLDLGSGTGTDVLGGIVTFLQGGGSVTRVITGSFLGLLVSPFVAFADIINAIGTFFSAPLSAGGTTIAKFFTGLFAAPLDLLAAGADISESALETFLGGSIAGILAYPITLVLVMFGLWIIIQYLQEPETGDTIPGLPFDIPDVGPFEFGVQEEDADEDREGFG